MDGRLSFFAIVVCLWIFTPIAFLTYNINGYITNDNLEIQSISDLNINFIQGLFHYSIQNVNVYFIGFFTGLTIILVIAVILTIRGV